MWLWLLQGYFKEVETKFMCLESDLYQCCSSRGTSLSAFGFAECFEPFTPHLSAVIASVRMNHTVIIRSDHTAAPKAIAWVPNNIGIVFRWRHSMALHIEGEQQTGSKIANSASLWCLEHLDLCGGPWPDTHQFTWWDFPGGWCICTGFPVGLRYL